MSSSRAGLASGLDVFVRFTGDAGSSAVVVSVDLRFLDMLALGGDFWMGVDFEFGVLRLGVLVCGVAAVCVVWLRVVTIFAEGLGLWCPGSKGWDCGVGVYGEVVVGCFVGVP